MRALPQAARQGRPAAEVRHVNSGGAPMVAAMEANLVYVFSELARALPGAEFHADAELAWSLTHAPFANFNAILATRLNAANVDEAIEAMKQRAKRKGVPVMWWLLPTTTPADLEQRLSFAGFQRGASQPGMWLALDSVAGDAHSSHRGQIATVDDESAARQWCAAFSEAFGVSRAFGQEFFPFAAAIASDPNGPLRNYMILANGEIAATASLAVHDGVAGIYNVATLRSARRHGFGTALTLHALREARSLGASHAVLQSSDGALQLYRRLGFRECCEVGHFIWR